MKTTKEPLLKFPCDFPLKVIGKSTLEFELEAVTIIRKHVPDLGEAAISIRKSKDGKFMAITALINATSREQLDNIYKELNANKRVLMTL